MGKEDTNQGFSGSLDDIRPDATELAKPDSPGVKAITAMYDELELQTLGVFGEETYQTAIQTAIRGNANLPTASAMEHGDYPYVAFDTLAGFIERSNTFTIQPTVGSEIPPDEALDTYTEWHGENPSTRALTLIEIEAGTNHYVGILSQREGSSPKALWYKARSARYMHHAQIASPFPVDQQALSEATFDSFTRQVRSSLSKVEAITVMRVRNI